jgi:tRNA A-37 threonylcarbamoyl transferase component Bud32
MLVKEFPGLEIWISKEGNSPKVEQVVENICSDSDYYFKDKIIKNDLATTVVEATVNEMNMIIKRINPKSFFTVLRRIFLMTRVERNWKYAHILKSNGIDTFNPILLVKKKWMGVCYQSYLYMNKINGEEARKYFESCQSVSQGRVMADKIIDLIYKLNKAGLRHRDLNLSNMIISGDKLYLIDLDAMKSDPNRNQRLYKNEINKFIENIEFLKEKNVELFGYFYNKLLKEHVV